MYMYKGIDFNGSNFMYMYMRCVHVHVHTCTCTQRVKGLFMYRTFRQATIHVSPNVSPDLSGTERKRCCPFHCLLFIGVGRFRILGGQGLEYWGAKGGAKFPVGT